MSKTTPLLASYLQRREDMRRFFHARLGPQAEVEDLLQELFVKVREAGDEEIVNPPAYLYRLASNLMLDRLRTDRRREAREAEWRRTHHVSVGALDVVDAPDAEASAIARQRLEKITAALASLAPMTQEVFRLHKFEGLTHAQTAEQLRISRSSVEKHISLALRHILVRVGR